MNLKKQKVLSSIKEGDIIKGKIATITAFGIFVDIGGIDGLFILTMSRINGLKIFQRNIKSATNWNLRF